VLGEDSGVVGDARAASVSTAGRLGSRRTIAAASRKRKRKPW
jgi:hypothetical protein